MRTRPFAVRRVLDPGLILEVDQTRQFNSNEVLPGPDGILGTDDDISAPRADPVVDGPFAALIPLVIRDNPATTGPDTNYLQYTGPDHVVLGGTNPDPITHLGGNDIIISSDWRRHAVWRRGQ